VRGMDVYKTKYITKSRNENAEGSYSIKAYTTTKEMVEEFNYQGKP
jgi:hypothetical protein